MEHFMYNMFISKGKAHIYKIYNAFSLSLKLFKCPYVH